VNRRLIGAASVVVLTGVLWALTRHAPPGSIAAAEPRSSPTSLPSGPHALTARAPPPPPVDSDDAQLTVLVTNHGAPAQAHVDVLRNALANTSGSGPSWEPQRAVDVDGRITLGVPAGQLLVVASRDGVARVSAAVGVVPGQAARVELALAPGHRVEGVVTVGRTSERVANAELRLSMANAGPTRRTVPTPDALTWHTSSATDGTFSFSGVGDGLYELEAIAPGYGRARVERVAVPGPATTVTLFSAAYVEGRVLLVDGSPAAKATVRAGGGDEVVFTDTSATGAFALEVEPGAFFLTAHQGTFAARSASRLTVAAGQTLKDVVLTLHGGATISGVVTNAATDAGAADAVVSLSNALSRLLPGEPVFNTVFRSRSELGLTHTDATGHYVIEGVAPGTWDLLATWQGRQTSAPGLVVLADEKCTQALTFAPLADVTGRVVHSDGGAFPNANVAVGAYSDLYPDHLPHTRTASDGTFRFEHLEPGSFIGAWADGSSSFESTYVEPGKRDEPITLTLGDGQGTVTGSVVPVPAHVTRVAAWLKSEGRLARTFTDGEGHFRLVLDEGSWSLESTSPSSPPVVVDVHAGAGSSVELRIDRLIKATALEPDGTPARGAWVRFDNLGITARADELGVASITDEHLDTVTAVRAFCERRQGVAVWPAGAREVTVRCEPAAQLIGEVRRAGPAVTAFTLRWFAGYSAVELHFAGAQFAIDEFPTQGLEFQVETDDGWEGRGTASLKSGEAGHTVVTVVPAKSGKP
jgi:hypothetical protein